MTHSGTVLREAKVLLALILLHNAAFLQGGGLAAVRICSYDSASC